MLETTVARTRRARDEPADIDCADVGIARHHGRSRPLNNSDSLLDTRSCTLDVVILERSKEQSSKTLDDFYAESAGSDDAISRESGQAMLDLIARLRRLEHPTRAWGLTSHERLCLRAQDDGGPSSVVISVFDRHNYAIEYLMPRSLGPWPNAYVRGEARSEDEAVQMIVTAIDRSDGWSDSRVR